jgi:septal ring factor EnvC (AmiA/AmiB activator)
MKPELYSCLKMLEALNKSCTDTYNSGNTVNSAENLRAQYTDIYEILSKHLTNVQLKAIPFVKFRNFISEDTSQGLLQELISATRISSAYIRSLDQDLNKDLEEKKQELELKEKEVESLKSALKDGIEAIKKIPEILRSEVVAKIKKAHRNIEHHKRKTNIKKQHKRKAHKNFKKHHKRK